MMRAIKYQLKDHCKSFVDQRIATVDQAIKQAQQSANEETKSSMGDKYETGRAMMQLELEKNSVQLAEAMKLKQLVDTLTGDEDHPTIQLGSMMISNLGNFYFSISAGEVVIDKTKYMTVSLASPIGMKARGLTRGDSFELNGRVFNITEVI